MTEAIRTALTDEVLEAARMAFLRAPKVTGDAIWIDGAWAAMRNVLVQALAASPGAGTPDYAMRNAAARLYERLEAIRREWRSPPPFFNLDAKLAELANDLGRLAFAPGAGTQEESDHRPAPISGGDPLDGVKSHSQDADCGPSGDEPGRIPSAPTWFDCARCGTSKPLEDGDVVCATCWRNRAADPPASPLPPPTGWQPMKVLANKLRELAPVVEDERLGEAADAMLFAADVIAGIKSDGLYYDEASNTWVARLTILTAGRTEDEARSALASAVKLTSDNWPPPRSPARDAE